jgi:hypothetical protein
MEEWGEVGSNFNQKRFFESITGLLKKILKTNGLSTHSSGGISTKFFHLSQA